MEVRNFKNDLKNSNRIELKKSWEKIIKIKFEEDCQILWKDNKIPQLEFGTDITVKTKKGRRYSIELKTRSNNVYENTKWIMEIISHRYDREDEKERKHLNSKDGWIYTTTAEYIFHGTLSENGNEIIECIFYSLHPFKKTSYKSKFKKFENLWLPTKFDNGIFQLTLNKLIPEYVIERDSLEFWKWSGNK